MSDGPAARRRRKMFALADEIGLTRDERMELARVILWRDVTSWKNLDDAQVIRVLDALEGYGFVMEIRRQRGESVD